jgi:hypothetical protein
LDESKKLLKAETDESILGTNRLFALSGFITGALVLIAYVAETISPSPPSPTLLNFTLSQTDLALFTFRSFAWGLFAIAAIPFFAMIARLLAQRSAERAWVAALLSAVGISFYALRAILQDSALTVAATTVAPSATEAAYQANLLFWMVNPLLPLGGAIWGLGFILFGILARKRGIFPSWLTIVAVIGGVAGWAIFPVLNSNSQFIGYLFTEILMPFMTAIWCIGCAVAALRRG